MMKESSRRRNSLKRNQPMLSTLKRKALLLSCILGSIQIISAQTTSSTSAPVVPPVVAPIAPPVAAATDAPVVPETPEPTRSPTIPPTKTPTNTPTKTPTSEPTKSPTGPPTKTPTGTPTSTPTNTPTKSPTSSPTNTPTKSPTSSPTKSPTISPTAQPTKSPSFSPTQVESMTPTEATASPTQSPSMAPVAPTMEPETPTTPLPTPHPTPQPTVHPSAPPTDEPTGLPTKSPSSSPSGLLSVTPTITKSQSPSRTPTSSPTASPTEVASSIPTMTPSASPTRAPIIGTANPTVTGSQVPSLSPTESPTGAPSTSGPTLEPTETTIPSSSPSGVPSSAPTTSAPTSMPSISPSSFPSVQPTSSPTLSLQEDLVEVVMILSNAQSLQGRTIITWEDITAQHIRAEVEASQVDGNPIFDLQVRTNVNSQSVPTLPPASRRRLQQGPLLRIAFDADVQLRSLTQYNISALVGGSFNSLADRTLYLNRLTTANPNFFGPINDVEVSINGITQQDNGSRSAGGGGGGSTIFIIIGAVAGGVAFIIIIALIFLRRRRPSKQAYTTTTAASSGPERINTDILVERQDDISTLGEPSYVGHFQGVLEKDETVGGASIISGDYDFAKQFGSASGEAPPSARNILGSIDGGSAAGLSSTADFSGLGPRMDNSLFSDDSSFEQQFKNLEERFEVLAPAGKLGMVIDTPSGHVPVVHAIKDTSVLADSVQVGDRLLSVDDEDTTMMTAMQVSKLISRKADNPSRTLLFARSKPRKNSVDTRGKIMA